MGARIDWRLAAVDEQRSCDWQKRDYRVDTCSFGPKGPGETSASNLQVIWTVWH